MPSRAVAFVLAVLALAACTTGGDPPPGEDGGSDRVDARAPSGGTLAIGPLEATIYASDGSPGVQAYQAVLRHPDGREEDVTAETVFDALVPSLGTFDGATFTSSTERGGTTQIRGTARGLTASATLTVRLSRSFFEPGTSASDEGLFDGAEDASRAPSVAYPPDGVLVPPNLNELEWHYTAAGNDVFQLRFSGSGTDVVVYFTCETVGAGCGYTPSEAVWTAIAESEAGNGPVTVELRGASRAGGGVGASGERTIEFAQDPIVGGLYYWNAGAGAIRRYDFGRRGQSAENYMDPARAGASACVGCHALSRDGTRIAIGMDIPSPSPYAVYDVATREEQYRQGSTFGGGSNFFAFSPDAAQVMTSNGVSIVLRDAATGTAITDPLVANGSMPDWAPGGDRMVYAKPMTAPPCFGGFCGSPGVDSASLETMVRSGGSWAAGPTLVSFGGQNNYYPTFSPDGEWVLFNRSPGNANSFDAPDAQVWAVPAAGGAAVHLATASTGGDSWPKWDPSQYEHRGHRLMWFTFSSRRAYGHRLADGAQAQLWMAAFDPTRPDDPSLPAFWLPFQEIDSGNHIAQWVTEVNRQPCTDNSQCEGGEFCQEGICVPDLI